MELSTTVTLHDNEKLVAFASALVMEGKYELFRVDGIKVWAKGPESVFIAIPDTKYTDKKGVERHTISFPMWVQMSIVKAVTAEYWAKEQNMDGFELETTSTETAEA